MGKITSKQRFCYIFCIISLIIFFAVFVALTFAGFFYSSSLDNSWDFPLGEKAVLSLRKNQSSSISFGFGGEILPGENLQAIVDFFNESEENLYVRVKVFVFSKSSGVVNAKIKTISDWSKSGEYYYFSKQILPQESINCLTAIEIPKGVFFEGGYIYNLIIVAECLSDYDDVEKLWGGLPGDE